MKKILPTVVLVGRVNVGKSTLFNRLSEQVKSLTFDEPGVTRDLIVDQVSWQGVSFELIDSGGIALSKTQDPIESKVRQTAINAINRADIIVLVCDGTTGILPEDRAINNFLFSLEKPIVLVVNKIDTKIAEENLHEFYQLGHKDIYPISAQHGTGSGPLLEGIVQLLKDLGKDKPRFEEPTKYKVTLIGKPNVGKSSLMNILVNQERSIISDIAGTTREAVSEPIKFYQETIQITDTPGVRRKRGVTEKLEQLMVQTAFKAIEDSDIVLLLVDGSEGILSDQELKLAFYVFEHHKALIILINKTDLMTELDRSDLTREIDFYQPFLRKVPQLTISCKTGQNVGKIMPLIDVVWKRYSHTFDNLELTTLFKQAFEHRPHYYQGNLLIFYKAEQVKTAPITIILFVNESLWFGPSHLAFFENVMRKKYDLVGSPINFILRKRYKS